MEKLIIPNIQIFLDKLSNHISEIVSQYKSHRTEIEVLELGYLFVIYGKTENKEKIDIKQIISDFFNTCDEEFKNYLTKVRAYAIDMETATIFTVGFYNKIPTGALLLVSDSPMVPEGVKTEASDSIVTAEFVERHLSIGIESLKQLINDGLTVRHLQF